MWHIPGQVKKEDKADHIRKGLLVSHTFKFCIILAGLGKKIPDLRLVGEIPCYACYVS